LHLQLSAKRRDFVRYSHARSSTFSGRYGVIMSDPFSPADVEFRPVSTRLVAARYLALALIPGVPMLLLAAAFCALAIGAHPAWLAGVVVLAASAGWVAWLVPRQVRAIGYAERVDDLLIRRGLMFRTLEVVPYGRMQFVDVVAGPIQRKYDLATVKLHTASPGTDASIPGLERDEATRLRDQLAARGEAKMAGL